ncbi:hypothetical protein RND81_08G129600 [Saponaria officinalis]|uniref:Uncharacterized protein n=1 Tax=Saponaria officinalis TaxID=3572 RepID=A0AAW1J8E3_SAPOF
MMKTVGEDTHENSYQNNQDRSPVSLFLAAIDPPVFAQTTKCSTPDRLLEISERVFGFFVIFGFMFLFRIAGMVYDYYMEDSLSGWCGAKVAYTQEEISEVQFENYESLTLWTIILVMNTLGVHFIIAISL